MWTLGEGPRSLAQRFTLLRTFSAISALSMALVALALIWSLNRESERAALRQETQEAVQQADLLLRAGLLPARAHADPLGPSALRNLADFTAANLRYGGNVRVKVWGLDGTILYSDAAAAIGRRISPDHELAAVLAGTSPNSAGISDLNAPENATERGHFSKLLEVYVPIHDGSGRIVGAYEVYHDLSTLGALEADLRGAVWRDVGAGFLIVYLALFLVVRNASRRLVRHGADNARLLEEARRREADATLLYQVSERLRLDTGQRAALQSVLDSVCSTFGYLSCSLLLYDPAEASLYRHISAGQQLNLLWTRGLALGDGAIGRAAEQRRIVQVADVAADPHSLPSLPGTRSEMAVPLLAGERLIGVLDVQSARTHAFAERDVTVLGVLADQVAMAILNGDLFAQRESLYLAVLEMLARTIDARDPTTAGHSQRVAAYAVAIGGRLGLDAAQVQTLRRGGLLHDVGKIGVSDTVLNKPGALSPTERAEMERHTLMGFALLGDLPFLAEELPLIRGHHERWDGLGYPDGLAGEAIPLGARILAVADAYDAMISDRPYRLGIAPAAARERLLADSGGQFWPPAAAACVALLDEGALPGPLARTELARTG